VSQTPANSYTRSSLQLLKDGLWENNPGLVQLLGLCPLLAISNTAINAIGLGIATLITLIVSNTLVSLFRNTLHPEIRIPVFVLLIASIVTVIELGMKAWFHDLYLTLGIFIPLIVTNCMILGRAETFASKNNPGRSLIDAIAQGTGFLLVLVTIGSVRELIGHGTLFRDADLLLGDVARRWVVELNIESGMIIALLPPGAFMVLGLLLALRNFLCEYGRKKHSDSKDTNMATTQ